MTSSTTTKSENVASRFWNHWSITVNHLNSKMSAFLELNWYKQFGDRKMKNETVLQKIMTGCFTSLIGWEWLQDLQIWKTHVQNLCACVTFIVKYANLGCCHRSLNGCLSSLTTSRFCPLSPTPPSTESQTKQNEPAWLSQASFQPAFWSKPIRLCCNNMTRNQDEVYYTKQLLDSLWHSFNEGWGLCKRL